MKMLSFLGETPTIALRKAQQECGEDAIVISTKKISHKSKDGVDMYEIIVALEQENIRYSQSPSQSCNTTTTSQYLQPTHTTIKIDNDLNARFYNFQSEILKMQESIQQVQKTLWTPKSQLFDLAIPPEFIDIYTLFEQNELDQEITYSIFKKTIIDLPISLKSNPQKITDFFKLVLKKIIPIKYEILLKSHQRKIMMLVGPTGVGKTTSVAKLAARFAYKVEVNFKVGIITLDSFRVGAIEQLQTYANIMRLPLEIVKEPQRLPEAILKLKDCNYILIDTAGSSQYDVNKIELINKHLLKVDELPIDKILVLPANTKQIDLQEIYNQYKKLDITNLIFTKLDETKSFGNLISFAHKTKKSICYFSIGQDVPDDLIVSDSSFLIDCFIAKKMPNLKK